MTTPASLYQSGATYREIAEVYMCSPSHVRKHLQRQGIEPRKAARRGPGDDVVAAAVEAYERGRSADAVACMCGVAKSTVLRWLRRAGVQVRSTAGRFPR